MAEYTGPDYRTIPQSGEYGNARVATFTFEATGQAAASVLLLGTLPGNAKIHNVILQHDDLGTGNTLDVGYRYKVTAEGTSDTDYWFDAQDTATAAARVTSSAWPVTIAPGQGVEVVAVANSAAVTGTISLTVEYTWLGQ